LLEPTEATLNDIATAIALSIEFHHSSAITTRWDYWYDATLTESNAKLVAIVSFVAGKMGWSQAWATATDAPYLSDVDKPQELRRIVRFASRDREREWVSGRISSKMYLRTEPSAAASKRSESPFFPPAACWWARITVLSIQCMSQSINPFASAISLRVAKIRCHLPFFCQR
jgi:hypothetical protein